jgi:hypothetical protein
MGFRIKILAGASPHPAARKACRLLEAPQAYLRQHASNMSGLLAQLEQQRLANTSALSHFEAFRGHREQTTRLLLAEATRAEETLCVLGAGNAYDLELEALLERFTEVHLVDIDADAVARARERVSESRRGRLIAHAPLDLSGMFHDIERFAELRVTPQDLMAAPAAGVRLVTSALPGPFDVVASTCLLTQLQLSLLRLLGEHHRLFVVLRELLSLTHLRTLAALTKPDGRALLVTDLCGSEAFPAGRPESDADLAPLMAELVAKGHVVHSSHPRLIQQTLEADPTLARAFGPPQQSAPWLWQNGPERCFLVYGLRLPRLA